MKTNFKNPSSLLLVLLAILISVNFVQAQQHGQQGKQQGPPPIPNDEQIKEMVNDLSDVISLTEEQEKQISALYFAHFEEARKLREQYEKERTAKREEMDKFRKNFVADVKANLNQEQKEQFDTYQKEQRKNRNRQGKSKR